MKEHEKCKTNAEVIFNNILLPARNPIECAFGRLKSRWAILGSTILLNLENFLVLHNFVALRNNEIDEEAVQKQLSTNERDS